MLTSTLFSRGRTTLPKAIRERLGLQPGDLVGFEVVDGRVVVSRAESFDASHHEALPTTLEEWAGAEDDRALA